MQVFEFMVPTHSNHGKPFGVELNRWEAMLAEWFGGFTRFPTVTGFWVNPEGIAFRENVVPYRVATDRNAEAVRDLVGPYLATTFEQEAVYIGRIGTAEIIAYN